MTFRKVLFTSDDPGASASGVRSSTSASSGQPVLYFDFVDPLSYLACRMIDRAGAAEAVEWRGFELRPPPQPMIDPRSAEWGERQATALAHARRLERPGPDSTQRTAGAVHPAAPPPHFIPWTRKAHELCEFARDRDCLHAVRDALFRAHFVDRTDIGRIDLLARIAEAAGLDRTGTRAVLDVDRYAAAVMRNRERAVEEGVRGVPALVRSGERLEGPEVLREIERAAGARAAATREGSREE